MLINKNMYYFRKYFTHIWKQKINKKQNKNNNYNDNNKNKQQKQKSLIMSPKHNVKLQKIFY